MQTIHFKDNALLITMLQKMLTF